MTAPTPTPDHTPDQTPDQTHPPLKLVKMDSDAPLPHPLHDTSSEDRPLALPVPVARGVYTANWFLHEGERAVVLIAVNSRGVVETFQEVSTVRQATEAEAELYRLLDTEDPVAPPPIRLEPNS